MTAYPTTTSRDDTKLTATLAQNWWAFALRGVIGILFGVIAFAAPAAVILSLTLLFGAYLIVDGVFGIIAAVRAARAQERWIWLIVNGVLSLIMGLIAVVVPGIAAGALILMIGFWAVLSGITMLVSAFRLNAAHGRWWLALGGVVSLVWGVLIILAPLVGAIVLTWWLGGYAIVFGVMLLIFAFRLRALRSNPAAA